MRKLNLIKRKKKNLIEYIPDIGFIFNSKRIEWKINRDEVRKKLKLKFKEDDRTINIAEFFDGDKSKDIHLKRDIYENIVSDNDLIFINYDSHNKLTELEIHYGYKVKIEDIQFDFKMDVGQIIKKFQKRKIKFIELDTGNFLFPKLKITISDSESMGGDGKKLSYFYSSCDITHLIQ